jgi:hypothetical protein
LLLTDLGDLFSLRPACVGAALPHRPLSCFPPLLATTGRRLKTREWVQDIVQKLKDGIDEMEAELEAIADGTSAAAAAGGGGKKKEKEVATAVEGVISNHRFHIDKLEAITRLLDNDAVDPDDVDALKDDVEYYVEQVGSFVGGCDGVEGGLQ